MQGILFQKTPRDRTAANVLSVTLKHHGLAATEVEMGQYRQHAVAARVYWCQLVETFDDLKRHRSEKVIDHESRPLCTLCKSFTLTATVSRKLKQAQVLAEKLNEKKEDRIDNRQ